MEIVDEIRSRIPRSSKHTPAMNFDLAGLELFAEGKTVFTTDADWSLVVRFVLPEYCIVLGGTPPVLPRDGVLGQEDTGGGTTDGESDKNRTKISYSKSIVRQTTSDLLWSDLFILPRGRWVDFGKQRRVTLAKHQKMLQIPYWPNGV